MVLLAVVDVETTGLNPYRHDRVVEVAALVVSADGQVIREFVSLVNPERDVGPTRIHGISAADVRAAPRFGDIAGSLAETLDGSVAIAGHNVRFDLSFLRAEFERLGHSFPDGPSICTLGLAGGGKLLDCCADYGVGPPEEDHTALGDARATARLLARLLADAPGRLQELSHLSPIVWPTVQTFAVSPLTRLASHQLRSEPPTYLQRLVSQVRAGTPSKFEEVASQAYMALLDSVLEDRRVDEIEGEELLEVAARWGLSGPEVLELHRSYLHQLLVAAMSDGVITAAERRDISLVAQLLGVQPGDVNLLLDRVAMEPGRASASGGEDRESVGGDALVGKRVCFTGELQCCRDGVAITREAATRLAEAKGLVVAETVTKKLDLLVVADAQTLSGKAKRARQYGVRIMHEVVFWNSLGIKVE